MTLDLEEQSDELLALSSILDPNSISHSPTVEDGEGHVGSLDISVQIETPLIVHVGDKIKDFTVRHLPPVKLEFRLPVDYPSSSSPLVAVSCPWLKDDQKMKVEGMLKDLWDPGVVVLFTWINFVQEEILTFLDLKEKGIDIHSFSKSNVVCMDENPVTTVCDIENIKIIDDDIVDDDNYIDENEVSANKDADATCIMLPSSKDGSIPDLENVDYTKKRFNGTTISFCLATFKGVVRTEVGEVLVKQFKIATHNPDKLEVSLDVGEEVELDVIEINGVLEGVNVTGLNGQNVRGHKDVEIVRVIEEGIEGVVERWNNRSMDGTLRGQKGEVYAYTTCVQTVDGTLVKGDKVRFNVVQSKKWGVLASFVRRIEDRDENKVGTVKKWSEEKCRGIIRCDDGSEWSFNLDDCLDIRLEGFNLYTKGDKVTFLPGDVVISRKKGTPKAVKIKSFIGDDDRRSGYDASSTVVSVKSTKQVGSNPKDKVLPKDISNGHNEDSEKKKSLVEETPKKKISTGKRTKTDHLANILREYNNMRTEEEFLITLVTCEICFTSKTGNQCLRFVDCDHVYCRDCMTYYFTEKISTGSVSSLTCPTQGCKTQALPNQVADLVPDKLYQKYEQLLLETQLESMTDVVNCPRLSCQCPTMIDRDTNLGQCPGCQFAFCIYCKATYHGVSPCKFKTKEQRAILDTYNSATGDERNFLEKRYGARQLASMAATLASEDYLSKNARHCPHCNAPIEKNEGCNKITCWRCNTFFCWLCGDKLPQTNPYTHFNVVNGRCFGALFQGVDPDNPNDDDLWDDDDNWEEVQAAIFGI